MDFCCSYLLYFALQGILKGKINLGAAGKMNVPKTFKRRLSYKHSIYVLYPRGWCWKGSYLSSLLCFLSKRKKLYNSYLVAQGLFVYYLQHRKSFGSSVEIDAYERESQVGGRMRTVELNGNEVEAGGTIIQDSNKYMLYFINKLGKIWNIKCSLY